MRYRIKSAGERLWLAMVKSEIREDGTERVVAVVWVDDPANAMIFPGVKSAARMIDRLEGWGDMAITNGRGERVR